nr:subtilisin [Prochlorococcus sp.]
IDPPTVISTPAAVTSTANLGDTGLIGSGLGEYTLENVELNIEHSWAGDLVLQLQSPNGNILTLSDGNGGETGLDPAADLVFTDASANDITSWGGGAPLADYMPEGGVFATVFAGEPIDGDWFLIVDDTFNGDGGTLNSYCITFELSVGTPPEIFCPADFVADNDEGVCGAVVNFAPPIAIDFEDGVLD